MRSLLIGWARALELERQDRLKEAEDLLDNCGGIAELYAVRMRRLRRSGPAFLARALDAFRASERWMETHAGDGEEGAWSFEVMMHRERLVRDLGFDPADPAPRA